MCKRLVVVFLLGGAVHLMALGVPQKSSKQKAGVPDEYAGNWVCQTAMPGYNITPPHADPSQPATSKMTTPPTVAIMKFTLKTDGSYEGQSLKGHYEYDSVTKSINWLDGPHEKKLTKTTLGKRDNGAPKMGFTMNRRYYGCFMPKTQSKS